MDFGRFTDFCALSVLSRELYINVDTGLPERDHKGNAEYFYQCMGLRRWPLRTQFTEVIKRLVMITRRPDIARPIHVVCDATGLGSPIIEQVRTALEPYRDVTVWGITITGGEIGSWSPNRKAGGRSFNISKLLLVSTLAEVLGCERLMLCPRADRSAMENMDVLERELRAFKVRVSKTGYQGFEAMGSDHDDCVVALALPLWVSSMPFASMSICSTINPAMRYLDDDDDQDEDEDEDGDTIQSREQLALATEAKQKADAEALKTKTQQLASWQVRVNEEAARDFFDDRAWGV